MTIVSVENHVIDACPLCDSSELEPIDARSEIAQNRTAAFEFFFDDHLCLNCGFVFSRTRPFERYLEQYYRDYFSSMSAIPDSEAESRAALITQHLDPGASILEVGGGYGTFQKFLLSRGYEVDNFDLSSKSITKARYDAICHYYVMEHVTDPRKWLADQVSQLRDGGYIFLEVPNFIWCPTESLNNEHLNHFRPVDVERIFASVGLQCLALLERSEGRYFGQTAVAKKSGVVDHPQRNGESASEILKIYSQLRQEEDHILSMITHFISQAGCDNKNPAKIGLWPASQRTLKIIQVLRQLDIKPSVIIDIDPEKQDVLWAGECPVQAPSEHAVSGCDLFLTLSPQHAGAIKENLAALGFDDERVFSL